MSPELKQKFVEFYEKDENNRIFPGKKRNRVCVTGMVKNPRLLS